MATGTDGAWHRRVEFDMSSAAQNRATYISHQDWANGPTIRIQKRAGTGRAAPGTEFPARLGPELIAALPYLTDSDG